MRTTRRQAGYTLIELMIVVSILLILISIAVPQYRSSVKRARESVLRQDLFTMRSVISQYTLDKQKMPQSADDLLQAGYLKQIPTDPITSPVTASVTANAECVPSFHPRRVIATYVRASPSL